MSPRLTLAAARTGDVGWVARLEAATFPTPWSPEELRAALSRPHLRLRVARRGEAVVGYLLAQVVADEAEILSTAVAPRARRAGVGRALLADLFSLCEAEAVARIHLEVRRDNAAARRLYARAGFGEVGTRRGYYGDGEDAILMRWSRPPAPTRAEPDVSPRAPA